jgi:hypothetical protein
MREGVVQVVKQAQGPEFKPSTTKSPSMAHRQEHEDLPLGLPLLLSPRSAQLGTKPLTLGLWEPFKTQTITICKALGKGPACTE